MDHLDRGGGETLQLDLLSVPMAIGASIAAAIGLVTTISAIVFAGFPADDDPNKVLAVVKVIGLTAMMIFSGVAIYLIGRRKALRAGSFS